MLVDGTYFYVPKQKILKQMFSVASKTRLSRHRLTKIWGMNMPKRINSWMTVIHNKFFRKMSILGQQ